MSKTTVRSDDLTLLAYGIKRALLNRGSELRMGIDESGGLFLKDVDTGEIVYLDLGGNIHSYF